MTITGSVTANRQIEIRFDVLGADGAPHAVDFAIDTGFNGDVTLPPDLLAKVGGLPAGTRRAELGDGSHVELAAYLVDVDWLGATREVLALEADAMPLAGVSLLWGSRVTLEVCSGGTVVVEPLDSRQSG